jgi:hypothetical protein
MAIRGIRDPIPSGHLLGRVSTRVDPVELIPMAQQGPLRLLLIAGLVYVDWLFLPEDLRGAGDWQPRLGDGGRRGQNDAAAPGSR